MTSNSGSRTLAQAQRHILHPWDHMQDRANAGRLVVARAEGIHLISDDGRRLLDGPGGMWCVNIGHGRAEMAEAAAAQMHELSYASPFHTASGPSAELAERLTELSPPSLNTVHFTTGGSSAVDTALRTVHYVNNRTGRPGKKMILAREKGYHGSTYLAASVSGKERDKSSFDAATDLVHFLPDVAAHRRPEGVSEEEWCDAKVADLEWAIDRIGADRIGGFIAEPVLSSGGVLIPPKGYHQRTLDLCREHDIFYISDEVVTAFGRLGHWFASQEVFGIEPDFITCAKGLTSGYLPLGACLIHDRVMDRIQGDDHDVLYHNGYTYSGHPVSCAVALKNIEIFEREGILEHVRQVTPYFQERLADLARHSLVGNARGAGLIGCLEGTPESSLQNQRDLGARLDEVCEEMGLIVRPLINMAVFSPPLIITKAQIDEMMDILDAALTRVSAEFN
ncbi:MAG: aminotransferase [Pseudomonadota bacterium]